MINTGELCVPCPLDLYGVRDKYACPTVPMYTTCALLYQTYQTNNGLGTPTQPLYSTGIPLTPQTIPGTNFLPNPLSFPTGVFPRLHKPYKYLKAMKRKHDGNYGNANASAPPGLLQPLYCKVCCVNLNAPSQAKQHYEGKAHSKKLKQYLSKEATENSPSQSPNGGSTGSEPVSPNDKSTDSASVSPSKSTTDIKPDVYCKVCGVSFNSEKQSLQHYNGKSHVKRLRATHTATNPVTSESAVSTKQSSKFICFVCNIDLTSQGQLDNHLKGMKHLATMQKQERSQTTLKGRWGTNGSTLTVGAVASLPMGIRQATNGFSNFEPPPTKRPRYRDFSNYRTPSGNYYCSYCNVTMATEPQFGQHIESKKHKATYSQKKTLEQCESPVESVA
ncbi:unnamed protein product [Owenia fusiformis]|uniref:C2H2-type domain-containing protein n=1 Tax=Owenia fusiformis TaxID=6347 RepID=A0A8S4N599_OWEFU|nr:unnamed protein product [Owenia fusiformis]